eukprot:TRINITY_DN3741_c3_g1_i1.p1 TRINITY_DN3741_c3_g1~~TRINITY_DN3741_c3_g1_i1.p1  ORF type:complete len:282 (-),score=48.08 TRINITY_DN3741_c3_g1_i1:119-964(-)
MMRQCGVEDPKKGIPRRLIVNERGVSTLAAGLNMRKWSDREALRDALRVWGERRGFEVRFVVFGALTPCEMIREVSHAGIMFGASGADVALSVLLPRGAVLLELHSPSCGGTGGVDWRYVKAMEEACLLGGHNMQTKTNPLPISWQVGARERLEKLRQEHGGLENCAFLHHKNKTNHGQRRRYFKEDMKKGEGFLSSGGWWADLARQRNILHLNIQRCKCKRKASDPNQTYNESDEAGDGDTIPGGNCMESPTLKVNAELHVIPTLDIIADEYVPYVESWI